MTTENRGDEQRYNPAANTVPDMPPASNDSRAAVGQDVPPYGAAYPPGNPNHYPGSAMPGAPNPGLAALLGFIPGVGAMYNGQFAKGLAHIAIFAVFCSLSNNVNDIFGLFVAGWVLYMAFEAYQTAVARREGYPLPDPFGLNTVGERFGFRANPNLSSLWGHGAPPPAGTAPQQGTYTPPEPYTHAGPYTQPGYQVPQSGFHVDPAGTVYRAEAVSPFGAEMPTGHPVPDPIAYNAVPPAPEMPYGPSGYVAAPYGVPPIPPMPVASSGGLPAGALWLIGLGFLALLGSIRAFDFLEGESTGGIFLIGLSLFLFWRRQNQIRQFYPPGSSMVRWNVIQGTRGASILFVVGLLTLLQGLRLVSWENSWPFLLIALGVLLLLERLAQNQLAATAYAARPPVAQPEEQQSSPTSILPRYTHTGDDPTSTEGR